ncbi:MAG: 4Fe-4S binding protein [Planctomycetota bacterium]|jgi:ferredoxin
MSQTITQKLMLFFPKCECEKPIIYHLVKDHNLIVNVYRAKVTPEEEGYLLLDVTGTQDDIQKGLDFVKTFDVSINYAGKGLTWHEDRCTHCGHCITHCPTAALHIADTTTREVGYDEKKCIECMACVRVCPYAACESVF